jgi:hypothetical protein
MINTNVVVDFTDFQVPCQCRCSCSVQRTVWVRDEMSILCCSSSKYRSTDSSLVHFIHLFTCSLVHLFTCSLHSLVHFIHLFTCSLVHLFTCSLVHFIHLFTSFTCSLVHLFTCSLVHLFTCSLVHLFTCSLSLLACTPKAKATEVGSPMCPAWRVGKWGCRRSKRKNCFGNG